MSSTQWLDEHCSGEPQEIIKATQATRAWLAVLHNCTVPDARIEQAEISNEQAAIEQVAVVTSPRPFHRRWGENHREVFIKWYPPELAASWGRVEAAIAAANLHPAIVALRGMVTCADGVLFIYDRVNGENLGSSAARARFSGLALAERVRAVVVATAALAAISEAGFMVVDWYEGNMMYDFDAPRLWLFDWELCRAGGGFRLEMDSNYGSSRLMAPEEFVRGSWLDQKTIVFNLGRYALLNLPELAEPLAPVLARATYPARAGRYATAQEFIAALQHALNALGY